MPFHTPLLVQLLDDRSAFPWLTVAPLVYSSDLTGDTYTVPKWFRTDGSSVPKALIAVPVVGQALALRFMGQGIWMGFKQGVLHDYLRRKDKDGKTPVPAKVAHLIFREALYDAGYPDDMCEAYVAAVRTFNSA
jgi:hypothetical protein